MIHFLELGVSSKNQSMKVNSLKSLLMVDNWLDLVDLLISSSCKKYANVVVSTVICGKEITVYFYSTQTITKIKSYFSFMEIIIGLRVRIAQQSNKIHNRLNQGLNLND